MAEMVAKTKQTTWKYFGAMFMETKNGQQAVSFHKVLGLVMFGWCLWQWSTGVGDESIDRDAVYTLWGLLGLKGVSKVMELRNGKATA